MGDYSLKGLIDLCDTQYREKTCFAFLKEGSPRVIRYAQFIDDVEEMERSLSPWLSPGDRVVIIGESVYRRDPESTYLWIVAGFAAVMKGCTLVPLGYDDGPDRLEAMVGRVRANLVIQTGRAPALRQDSAEELRTPYGVCRITREHEEREPLGCAYLFFTSGSTGDAKGVELSEDAVFRSGYEAGLSFELYGSTYLCLPLSHIYGYCVVLVESLFKGIVIYLLSGVAKLYDEMALFQPETVFLVPSLVEATYDMRIAKEGVKPVLGASLKSIFVGGGMSDSSYVDKYKRNYGINVLNGYGITETAGCICMCTERHNRRGSVGRPVLNTDFKIVDGEICVKTSHVMNGYYDDQESTQSSFYGPWYRTGDLGYFDDDGYLFITGRRREVVALPNGKNIVPDDLETAILEIDGVRDANVRMRGRLLTAEIDTIDGRQSTRDGIRDGIVKLNGKLPPYMHIQEVFFVGERQ